VLEAIVRKLLEKDPNDRPPSGNSVRELFELYERDRASCAMLLGVDIPVEDRRTSMVEELDDAEVTDEPDEPPPIPPRDPERDYMTDEIASQSNRRIAAVALCAAVAFALVLYLALRGGDKPTAPVVALSDAPEEVALAVTKHEDVRPDPKLSDAVSDTSLAAIAPAKQPAKKPGAASSGAGSGSPAPAVVPPSASEIAKLYGATGRELKALETAKGMESTLELWPRYRWIRINDWIATPERRAQVAQILERLRLDIKAAY
jgi:hypothetical protein